MLNLQLISIWEKTRTKNMQIEFHSHKYHELVYYTYGNGITTIGEKNYSFSDNCFVIIPPNTPHNEYHYSDSHVICLEFSGADNFGFCFLNDLHNTTHRILKELLGEIKNQYYGYKDMICTKLNELYMNILRNENSALYERNFEYVINYLKENYHEKIILYECARQLNISYDYFQHKFKAITGYSPQQFLIKQRLSAAKELLISSNLNCTEIAYRCGFSTSAQFSEFFKRYNGITPFRFRNMYKKELAK